MADAAAEFLLLKLKQLLVYDNDLILDLKRQLESLYNHISMFKAFLKDSSEKRNDYETVKTLVRQIRAVVYESEDVIDTFAAHTAVHRSRGPIPRLIHGIDYLAKLHGLAKGIQSIREKVDEIYRKQSFGFEALQLRDTSGRGSPEKKAPVVEEENVVGFDEINGKQSFGFEALHIGETSGRGCPVKKAAVVEEENIVGFEGVAEELIYGLNAGGKEEVEVVAVIGMGGLGKTTLARKIFTDSAIEFEFYIRAWVYVSQEYNRKEVFLGILSSLGMLSDEMHRWSDEELADELRVILQRGRYLVVLDDVWTKGAWDDLKMAFPMNNNRSRILLTSRDDEVAFHATDRPPYWLRFLNDDESWELLEKKVFRKEKCPSELEDLGRGIAKECGGLPLAIVVIAGLLMKKEKTCDWWKKVAKSVSSYVARDPKQCMDILALSYNYLPYHLKACFLYLGVFPENYEIPVWKLIQLWVAEGFIQQVGEIRLEDTAEEQLEDLVDRNLLLVEKRRSDGGIKTCRIHVMLRNLCLREAKEEQFLNDIKGSIEVPPLPFTPITNQYRRLCIHSGVLDYISSKPSDPHVRSFFCFPVEETELRREHSAFIHKAFKLLRVLDIGSVKLSLFPVKMKELVHLRYIALSGNFEVLPGSISDLWNLQTIIIETSSRNLEVKADIWRMLQLRHIHTNASCRLHGPPANVRRDGRDPLVRSNLQTISALSPESCTGYILARTPNLKKLGIRGKLAVLVEEKGGRNMFDNLARLDHLVALKLLNDTFPSPPCGGTLPQLHKFAPNLKKLTLADTLVDWQHMSTLGLLPELEVLKLKENAFRGTCWQTQDGGFRRLRFLQIGRTDLVIWEASSHHFPRLERLVLKYCEKLQEVPSDLGDVSSLHVLELYHASPTAVASANEIQKRKHKLHQGLKLLVYLHNHKHKMLVRFFSPPWIRRMLDEQEV